MSPSTANDLRRKVRVLTGICLLLWFSCTLAPVLAARHDGWNLWGWPVDFWMAAQGCLLMYLLIVAGYAALVNRWERQAGALSFESPPGQDG